MNGSLQPSSRWGRQDQAFQVSQAILADVSGPELPPPHPCLVLRRLCHLSKLWSVRPWKSLIIPSSFVLCPFQVPYIPEVIPPSKTGSNYTHEIASVICWCVGQM